MPEPIEGFPKTHALDRRDDAEPEFSPEWETKTAISRILGVALKPISFRQQLEEIIDVIVSISWLGAVRKGAIFVANERQELILAVQHDLSPALLTQCALVPFGKCLCGRAALRKQILFKSCVDEEHEITFPGMTGHGHYNIPLLGGDDAVIGVIVLYLEDHHEPHPEEEVFTDMVGQAVASILTHRSLDLQSEIGRIQLQQAHVDMMSKLVSAAEYRDHETGDHLKRMSRYSVIIGRTIGLPSEALDLLGIAAPMHDIGKVGIPDEILMKPGKLTDDEYAVMKRHPEIGANILSGDNPLMKASHDIALGHHEKWDGSGYPRGLVGEETPLFARICALADVFDALTTRRPYKEPWPLERTLSFIRDQSGSHFDPNLVEALHQSLDEILEIASLFGDDDDDSHLFGSAGATRASSNDEPARLERLRRTDAPGVEVVARQHRFIMEITQRLETAAISMDTREFFDCLNALQANLSAYLVNEENLMRQCAYPKTDQHELAHRDFAALTRRMFEDLESAPLAASFAAPRLIGEWVRAHIQGHGSELLGFLREQSDRAEGAATRSAAPIR